MPAIARKAPLIAGKTPLPNATKSSPLTSDQLPG
jgi:hypothetical protein